MKREEALKSLGLHSDPNPVEVSAACETRRRQLEERLSRAPTPALRKKYETALTSLEKVRSLALGVDEMASEREPVSQETTDLPAATPVTGGGGQDATPQVTQTLELGTTLKGRYELRRLLGAGGMGAVYGAFDREGQKEVAIKVLLPELLQDGRARERFIAEGRITHALSHPGIVEVFEVGFDGASHFIAMELLQGKTLRREIEERIRAGKTFSVREVQRIARALCEALGYAHEHTVHRDVKPENIWIGVDGSVKVMDFGIAKFLETACGTQSTALGTAYYMAPEQMKNPRDVDVRADQYSLGVVLYELLTGQVPAGIIEPVRTFRKDVPAGLEQAIERTLSPKPDRRFRDMEEFASMLEDRTTRSTKSISGKRESKSTSPVGPVLIGVMGLAALGGVGYWMWQEDEVRKAIDTGVAAAASATDGEDTELETAIASLQNLLTEFEGRPEEELEAARTLLEGLEQRKGALDQAPSAAIYETIKMTLKRFDQLAKRLEKDAQQSRQRVNSLRSKLLSSRLEPEQRAMVEKDVAIAEEELARTSRLDRLANKYVFHGVARKSLELHWNQGKDYLETAQLDKARDSFATAAVEVNRLSTWPDRAKEFIAIERTLAKRLDATLPRLREEERALYSFVVTRLKAAGETIESGDAHAAHAIGVKLQTAIEKADEAVELRRECMTVRRRVERLASVPTLASALKHGDDMVAAAAAQAESGQMDDSLQALRDARAHFEELHVRAQEEARRLLADAREQRDAGNYKKALEAAKSALEIAPEDQDVRRLHARLSTDTQVASALEAGRVRLEEGNLRSAGDLFRAALELSPQLEQTRDKETVARAFFDLAEAYKSGTGVGRDLSEAVNWYNRAALVFKAAGQRERVAACLFLEGTCFDQSANPGGSWPMAARAFELAALEYKALDLPEEYLKSRDAQAHATELSGDWNTAAGIHKELALLHERAQNAGAQADSLSRQAYCLEPSRNSRGSWRTASEVYKDAIRIYKKLGPEYRRATRTAILRQHDCVQAMQRR